jgi:protein disulfide-isomerase
MRVMGASLKFSGLVLMMLNSVSAMADIAWQTDLQAAHKLSQNSGKLMLVHFYSDNCVWCDRLEAGAFGNPQVSDAINREFIPVKIHAGKQASVANHFGVTQWPTDVIVDATGLVHGRSVSPQAPAEYVQMLTASIQHARANSATTMIAQSGPTPAAPAVTQPAAPAPTQQAAAPMTPSQPITAPAAVPSLQMPTTVAGQSNVPAMGMGTPPAAASGSFMLPAGNNAPPAAQTVAHKNTPTSAPSSTAPQEQQVAMEGFCPVSVVDEGKWTPGEKAWGVVHMGQVFLFASEAAQKKFLADPFRYAPVLTGMDVVRFFEGQVAVAGTREWSCTYNNRTYLFADQESYNRFYANCDRYDQMVDQVIQRVAMESASSDRIMR